MPRRHAHHYHPLVRSVTKALGQRCGVRQGDSIVVGCSGGADSVALLRALAMLAPRRKWQLRLIVAHVHHHLRQEAEDDAGFVEELANELRLPFARRDVRPANMAGNLEANARDLRYDALSDIASEHGASFIATAHHADDQLETLLMRIMRGTSAAGLRGIAWRKALPATQKVSDTFLVIRPLLGTDQRDLLGFLDALGQPWREDTTNADTSRTRAKLRHDIIPQLKQLQPDAANKASALIEHFGDLHKLLQSAADGAMAPYDGSAASFILSREQTRTMNRAVLTELLRRVLIDQGISPDRLSRHALLPAIHAAQDRTGGERRFTYAKGVTLVITRESLSVTMK